MACDLSPLGDDTAQVQEGVNNSLKVLWPEGPTAADGRTAQNPDKPSIPEALVRFA